MSKIAKLFGIAVIALVFTGCSDSVTIDLSNNSIQTSTGIDTEATTIVYDEWTEVQSGVVFKHMSATVHKSEERFSVVKIDPSIADLEIAVSEGNAKTVAQWGTDLDAAVVINAGYFDPEYTLTTRTIVEGESHGPLLSGLTGVARTLNGQDWSISDIAAIPDGKAPVYSVQSYPVLLDGSGEPFSGGSENIAQRSVIAQDTEGMVYLILAEYGVFTLDELALALQNELSLQLETALNLDGGTSSGLVVEGAAAQWYNASLPVPSVLYIK